MTERRFQAHTIQLEGHIVNGFSVNCGECGAEEKITNSSRNRLPPEAIAKMFNRKGWKVGRVAKRDRCPGCIRKSKKVDEDAMHEAVTNTLPQDARAVRSDPALGDIAITKGGNVEQVGNRQAVGHQAEKPKEMSREDRRLVFGEIDSVYLDASRGYENGYTDEKVAAGLGVPVFWVRSVREEMFGPASGDKVAKEVIALQARYDALELKLGLAKDSLANLLKEAHEIGSALKSLTQKGSN